MPIPSRFTIVVLAVVIAALISIAGLYVLKKPSPGTLDGLPAPGLLVEAVKDKPETIRVIVKGVNAPGSRAPDEYSCYVDKPKPPKIMWSTVGDAASYIVYVYDPDAPKGFFTHLAVIDLPKNANVLDLEEGVPLGAVVLPNDGGFRGWYPLCPPSGRHRYVFVVIALDTILPRNIVTVDSMLEKAKDHVVAYGYTFAIYP